MVTIIQIQQDNNQEKLAEKIGILFASYGDIDSINELKTYFKKAFQGILPKALTIFKPLLANLVWSLKRKELIEHYQSFDFNTHSRENSQQQSDLVQQLLQEAGSNAQTYIGFNFATPYIPDTLKKIQNDGITKLIVINQGAAYSKETTERNFQKIVQYLKDNRNWNVEVIGVMSFAKDDRFIKLIGDRIQEKIDNRFRGVLPQNICIFLPIHGLPKSEIRSGDPYIEETRYVVNKLTQRFSSYSVLSGYQDHQFLFITWSQPTAESVANKIAAGSWTHVLMNGRISFTVDNNETLGDEQVELRNIILNGASSKKEVFVDTMFNAEKTFAALMKDIIMEILQGDVDIVNNPDEMTSSTITPPKTKPTPPSKPDYTSIYTSKFTVSHFGECDAGSYVEIYKPTTPIYSDKGALKLIVYLHGFAMGASEIYRSHLEHLAQQGYYVIYPNYQRGFCQFANSPSKIVNAIQGFYDLAQEMFPLKPRQWMKWAIKNTVTAYKQEEILQKSAVDTYLFGHSLGGFFALSWPHFIETKSDKDKDNDGLLDDIPQDIWNALIPKQIIIADPIPNSAGLELEISKKWPKLKHKVKQIEQMEIDRATGEDITMPVAILHGNDDTIVKSETWQEPFQYIATKDKTMFLSFTDEHGYPSMYANHEQATVNTGFVPDWIATSFLNGMGREDNLNWRYIWYALDRAIRFGVKPGELEFDMGKWSDGKPVKPIQRLLDSL